VEQSPHMETIQVVLDSKLLRATEVAARRSKVNRSALIREALRVYLKNLATRERELRDRKGYEGGRVDSGDLSGWEAEAIWPEE
jgi:metal-responsive CopG/Arc/MetJ family transcriptional regulator